MLFKDFEKCMDLVRFWRSKFGREDYQWPDSRDPDLLPLLNECEVVPQDLEKSLVAIAAWREGHNDIYQGMSAIVHLIRNRQNGGMFRSHLTDSDQFPSMANPESLLIGVYPLQDPEFDKILSNLDDILNAKTVDLTQGSIYFGVVGDAMPQWFIDVTRSPELERTVKLNNTTFYRKK